MDPLLSRWLVAGGEVGARLASKFYVPASYLSRWGELLLELPWNRTEAGRYHRCMYRCYSWTKAANKQRTAETGNQQQGTRAPSYRDPLDWSLSPSPRRETLPSHDPSWHRWLRRVGRLKTAGVCSVGQSFVSGPVARVPERSRSPIALAGEMPMTSRWVLNNLGDVGQERARAFRRVPEYYGRLEGWLARAKNTWVKVVVAANLPNFIEAQLEIWLVACLRSSLFSSFCPFALPRLLVAMGSRLSILPHRFRRPSFRCQCFRIEGTNICICIDVYTVHLGSKRPLDLFAFRAIRAVGIVGRL